MGSIAVDLSLGPGHVVVVLRGEPDFTDAAWVGRALPPLVRGSSWIWRDWHLWTAAACLRWYLPASRPGTWVVTWRWPHRSSR